MTTPRARVACVIPARDEELQIAATVTAARALPHVELVLVCDDASTDATGRHAAAAGAVVVTHSRHRGRAAAVESAVNALGVLEQRDHRPECGTLLLLDADLGASAAACAALVGPVVADRADLTVAVPRAAGGSDTGALDLVVETATRGIVELTGWTPRAPLSTQRCMTRRAFELASPLAAGWGADVGMSVDMVRAGLRVEEVDVAIGPDSASRDLSGQLQRAAQLRDVTRALAARGLVTSGLEGLRGAGVSGLVAGGLGLGRDLLAKRRGRPR